jgi:hypothetical protein
MKTLTTLFALATLCATACGQTIKSLGYDTASGEVVANTGTNVLTFTNETVNILSISDEGVLIWDVQNNSFYTETSFFSALAFAGTNAITVAAETRTNLGLYNTNEPAAFAALALWDEVNDELGLRVVDDEIRVAPLLIGTSAPTDTTNAVKWIRVFEGTNSYRIPLFQ